MQGQGIAERREMEDRLEELASVEGNGTSLISLFVPMSRPQGSHKRGKGPLCKYQRLASEASRAGETCLTLVLFTGFSYDTDTDTGSLEFNGTPAKDCEKRTILQTESPYFVCKTLATGRRQWQAKRCHWFLAKCAAKKGRSFTRRLWNCQRHTAARNSAQTKSTRIFGTPANPEWPSTAAYEIRIARKPRAALQIKESRHCMRREAWLFRSRGKELLSAFD